MKDTIYREEAINAVLRNLNKEEYRSSWESGAVKVMKDTLEKMPTADRPQETCLKEAEILLKATRNLLDKQNESIYVLNMLEETVAYYGVECDGSCLIEDIDAWLELYGSEEGADDE